MEIREYRETTNVVKIVNIGIYKHLGILGKTLKTRKIGDPGKQEIYGI